jgi:GMP synthase (glutamine-hydrolysing)
MARVLGEVTPERVAIVRKATVVVEQEIRKLAPFQAFAVLLNDMGPGVEAKMEIRTSSSAPTRADAMRARPTPVPGEGLMKMSRRMQGDSVCDPSLAS